MRRVTDDMHTISLFSLPSDIAAVIRVALRSQFCRAQRVLCKTRLRHDLISHQCIFSERSDVSDILRQFAAGYSGGGTTGMSSYRHQMFL